MGTTIGGHCRTVAAVFSDGDLTDYLTEMVKVVCPELFEVLMAAYKAGHRWESTSVPLSSRKDDTFGRPLSGGPFLGRVMLWKLNVGVHRDTRDYLCAILNAGDYTGGGALFPDLGLKFKCVRVISGGQSMLTRR